MASTYLDRVENKALGEMLVEKGALRKEQVTEALDFARERGIRLGEALVQMGYIGTDALSYTIAEQYGQRPMELHPSMVDRRLVAGFDAELLRRHKMLPLIELGNDLVVVVADPNDQAGLDAISAIRPDLKIVPQLAGESQIRRCLDAILPVDNSDQAEGTGTARVIELRPQQTNSKVLPDGPEFAEWLWFTAAQAAPEEVQLRQRDSDLILQRVSGDGPAHEIERWENASFAKLAGLILKECRALSFSGHQAWRLQCRGSLGSEAYSFNIMIPVTEGPASLRIRAVQCTDAVEHDPNPSLLIHPGEAIVVETHGPDLFASALKILRGLGDERTAIFLSGNWLATTDDIPAYPGPLADVVAATQAHGAQCVLFDYLPSKSDLLRLRASCDASLSLIILTNPGLPPADLTSFINWPEFRHTNITNFITGGHA